ncbi:DUF362 domain-containing protein [Candidatus Woesearchaeota archaeon]|nr:DUF362 domain-containing protein [Candidatus Woesearchaeota archaeon]
METVSLVECKSYGEAEKAVKKSLSLIGGMEHFVKKGDKVLLKANMLVGKPPEAAATTNPEIIRAVIKEVRRVGGVPTVGDSPPLGNIVRVARKCGIAQLCKELGVPLLELDEPIENRKVRHFMISNKLKKFDVIINLPKIKTHSLLTYTGGVKNMFGCIPGTIKAEMHIKTPQPAEFSKMILDLYAVIKSDLTIIDGVVGMEGQGPGNGSPRNFNVVLASANALALDTAVTTMLGIIDKVPVQVIAKERGLIGAKIEGINIVGEDLEKFKIDNLKLPLVYISKIPPRLLNFIKNYLLTTKPAVMKESCIKCGDCFKVCPAKAIKMGPYPTFDYNLCIRCFCCDEVCPKKAIKIKENFPLRVYKILTKKRAVRGS